MLRNLATIGLILALATGGIVGCSEESTPDVETAARLIEEWAAGWNNDDVNALAAVFAEEATCACGGVPHLQMGRTGGHPQQRPGEYDFGYCVHHSGSGLRRWSVHQRRRVPLGR